MEGVRLKNKYFILRHGQTIHQIKKPGIIYFWPEDKPPANLTDLGRKQIKKRADFLRSQDIDFIFSSDVLRTRQTAEIIAEELGLKVRTDPRLRDINLGDFQGKPKSEFWSFFQEKGENFKEPIPNGENWSEVQKRMTDFINDVEKEHSGKNILIVGHGDPLWLLEGWLKGVTDEELLKEKKEGSLIKMGELRRVN
jgi:broad specificity phosphatase PhoE